MDELFSLLQLSFSNFPTTTSEAYYNGEQWTSIPKIIFHFLVSKALIDHLCENLDDLDPEDAFDVSLELTEEEAYLIVTTSFAQDTDVMIELDRGEVLEWLDPQVEDLYGKTIDELMEEAKQSMN